MVICPKCGEDNSDNFRFCGMCGTVLDTRRPAGAPLPNLPAPVPPSPVSPSPVPPKIANAPGPLRPPGRENATRPPSQHVPPISGPSMLGLNHADVKQASPNPLRPNRPSTDALRERAFSGFDSFLEPEQPKTGGRRILLLVALLAALGGAGWWTYTNYLGATERRKPASANSSAIAAPAGKPSEKPSTKPAVQNASPALDAGASQPAAPSAGSPEAQAENASAAPAAPQKIVGKEAKPHAKPAIPRIALGDKSAEKRQPIASTVKASKLPAPAAPDTGDAAFRKGEAYLYGRGVPENCDEAVKNLKAASSKSNAKARSTFGTMYATGHCVPRDLPTSYLWFALALRVDPNNQILEKDLSAIWNQMTPPERQMATRMKQ